MLRLVTGRPGTIRLDIYDEDGVAVDPTGTVSVTVRDGGGTTVSTGSATNSPLGVGVWTYTVPSSVTAEIDSYEATWTYTLSGSSVTSVTPFEVCGGHLFEIADLRAFDPTLADDTVYTPAMIRKARVDAEQRFENGAKLAFVNRAARVTLTGEGRPRLVLPHSEVREVLAIEVDGDPLDPEEVIVHSTVGVLEHSSAWMDGSQIDVFYLHGLDAVPEPVSRAVKTLAVEYLIPSGLPARATSQSTDLGEFRITVAGKDGLTGIPEVDSVMMDFGRRGPSIG